VRYFSRRNNHPGHGDISKLTASEHEKADKVPEPADPAPAPHVSRGMEQAARWQRLAGDFSGAFADLGNFLPLVVGMFAVQQLDPAGLLVGFGLFALVTAGVYQRPVPVQPMKAVAALVIGGGLSESGIAATGLLLGIILCILAALGAVDRLGRHIPHTVLRGIQLGIGLYLLWAGIRLGMQQPLVGIVALLGVLLLQRTHLAPLAALAVVSGAALWGATRADAVLPTVSLGLSLPRWILPDLDSLWVSAQEILLPQLALTLTNATLITAAVAADLFPDDRARITPNRLAWSSGLMNLVLAPFGAFPMCHGAGGLVVQHRFGARTGLAPAIFGTTCLALGLFLAPQSLALLTLLPMAAVGALLIPAGMDLAASKRLRHTSTDRLAVIVITGVSCLLLNVALGLLVGLLLEAVRLLLARRRQSS